MPLADAKSILTQVAVLAAVGTAVGVADLVVRGRDVRTELTVVESTTTFEGFPGNAEVVTPDVTDEPTPPVVPVEAITPTDPEPTPDVEPVVDKTPAIPDALKEPPENEMPELHITLAKSHWLYTEDRATFIDARPARDYLESHVAGSWSFPVSAFDNGDPPKLYELDAQHGMDRPLVIYCSGGHECEAAEDVALQLQMSGFMEIYIMHVGMPGWKAAGYPTGSGEDPNG